MERARVETALRESEEQLRSFGQASSDVLWVRDARTLAWTYLSPAFEQVYGFPRDEALAGDTWGNWLALILPEDRAHAEEMIRRVTAGERVTFEYRIRRPSDGGVRRMRNTDFPMLDAAGGEGRIGGVGHDVTDEVEMRDRLRVLVAKLRHRTRNLMGVVLRVMRRTRTGSRDLAGFVEDFESRLRALGRVNDLLSRLDEGARVTFGEPIRAELGALGEDGQVVLDGPEGVRLRSSTVQTFASPCTSSPPMPPSTGRSARGAAASRSAGVGWKRGRGRERRRARPTPARRVGGNRRRDAAAGNAGARRGLWTRADRARSALPARGQDHPGDGRGRGALHDNPAALRHGGA
jgi:PAS domain S-box-containing protein